MCTRFTLVVVALTLAAALTGCAGTNRLSADGARALTDSQPKVPGLGGEAVPIWVSVTSVTLGAEITVEVDTNGRDGDIVNVLAIGEGLDYEQLSDLLTSKTCEQYVPVKSKKATAKFQTNVNWKKTASGKQAVVLRFIAYGDVGKDTAVGISTITVP